MSNMNIQLFFRVVGFPIRLPFAMCVTLIISMACCIFPDLADDAAFLRLWKYAMYGELER